MTPLLFLFLASHITPTVATTEYKQPQLAASASMVAVTFGAGSSIYVVTSSDKGQTFSKPVKVATAPKLALGRHRGPRIAITPSSMVISAIVAAKPGALAGDLKSWRSMDGGKTWSAPVTINDIRDASREGLHGMVAAPNGTLFATWLDLRSKGMKLYGASSKDGGASWSQNVLVYKSPSGSICECCHPTALFDSHGDLVVMWRNNLGGNRDMYLARSQDAGQTFSTAKKLGSGTWPLKACPMDGGALAVDAKGNVVSIWRRAGDVFMAPEDAPETKIAAGKDASLAATAEGIYAVWSAGMAIHGLVPGHKETVVLAAHGGFPQLVAVPGGPVLAAWEHKGAIRIEKLVK